MSNPTTVHGLFYGIPGGFGLSNGATLRGLFATVELAEKRLLEIVLTGQAIIGARIDTLPVEQEFDERDPLNYPSVIGELIRQRKIQAIKNLRHSVPGSMYLKEAKDAVEAVNLETIPQSVREAAEEYNRAQDAAEKAEKERRDEEHKATLAAREAELRAQQDEERWEHESDPADIDFDVIVDGDDDLWFRVGVDQYVMKSKIDGKLGFKDDFEPLSLEQIEDYHGITDKYDN